MSGSTRNKTAAFLTILGLLFLLAGSNALARDWKKIGGSAAAGAVIGAIVDGKSGAALGAVAGGAGGYVWDEATDNSKRPRSKKDSTILIGATTAAGAATGAIIGGGKGALIGSAAGAAGGFIYDRKTNRRNSRSNFRHR